MMNNKRWFFYATIYCTRPIVLDNPTALEVRLTSSVQSTSSEVEVYFRTTSSEEVRDVKDLNWTPFNSDGTEKILQLHLQNQITNLKNTNIL